jgi:hypothetical protein
MPRDPSLDIAMHRVKDVAEANRAQRSPVATVPVRLADGSCNGTSGKPAEEVEEGGITGDDVEGR